MRLRLGEVVEFEDGAREVVALAADEVTLRRLDDGRVVQVSLEELELNESIRPSGAVGFNPGTDVLERLDPLHREDALFWLEALRELEGQLGLVDAAGMSRLRLMEQSASRLTAEGHPITARSLYRKLGKFRTHGVSALVDARVTSLTRLGTRVDERVISALVEVMASQRNRSTGTRGRLIELTHRELLAQHGDAVAMPSRATMYRLIAEMDRGQHVTGSAKTRRSIANRPQRQFSVSGASRPGEQVQIDSTKLDVMIELGDGSRVRPELTIMVDVATRSILAALVRPTTKSMDLVVLLARALTPHDRRPGGETETRELVSGSLDEDLPSEASIAEYRRRIPLIFPSTITTDRGAPFVSLHFREVCAQKGINLNVSAPYTPTDKGIVERTFQSINTRFTQYLAGYTGRGVEFRGKDDELALLSLQQLQQLIDDWIAVDWQERPHEALRDPNFPSRRASPNQMVRAAREVMPEVVIPMDETEYIRLMPCEWRMIQTYGVTIDNRTYDSRALAPYRRLKSPHRAQKGKWPFRHDPYNVQVVWLDLGDELLPLQWATPYSGAPMSADMWAAVRRHGSAGRDPIEETQRAAALTEIRRSGAAPTRGDRKARTAIARSEAVSTSPVLAVEPVAPVIALGVRPSTDGVSDEEAVLNGEWAEIAKLPRWRLLTNEDEESTE